MSLETQILALLPSYTCQAPEALVGLAGEWVGAVRRYARVGHREPLERALCHLCAVALAAQGWQEGDGLPAGTWAPDVRVLDDLDCYLQSMAGEMSTALIWAAPHWDMGVFSAPCVELAQAARARLERMQGGLRSHADSDTGAADGAA